MIFNMFAILPKLIQDRSARWVLVICSHSTLHEFAVCNLHRKYVNFSYAHTSWAIIREFMYVYCN